MEPLLLHLSEFSDPVCLDCKMEDHHYTLRALNVNSKKKKEKRQLKHNAAIPDFSKSTFPKQIITSNDLKKAIRELLNT